MEPYESTYVGSFIFTLGYIARETNLALHDQSVCLLAQNKGDQLIGDLIQQWDGRSSIIEFKRNEESIRAEFGKPHKKALLKHLARYPEGHVVQRGHFVAFGSWDPASARASIHVMSYSKIEDSPAQRGPKSDAHEFIHRMLSSGDFGFRPKQFSAYLEVLRRNASMHSSGGGAAPLELGTLVVNRSSDGQIRFLTCDITRTHDMTLELKRGTEPERDLHIRGPSRDMGWSR